MATSAATDTINISDDVRAVVDANVEKASQAFKDFVKRVVKTDRDGLRNDSKLITCNGLIDTIMKGSTSLDEKLALFVAIDFETAKLVSPSAATVPELSTLVKAPATVAKNPDLVENELNSHND